MSGLHNPNLLPLERMLERLAVNVNHFPPGAGAYFLRYLGILEYLNINVYPFINTGLCFYSAKKGIFTDHGPQHFDEVVRYAGQMLGIVSGEEDPRELLLDPYELYMLLVAIRVHDVGNLKGRESHEKEVHYWLTKMGTIAGNDVIEKRIIASIAEAHSGHDFDGKKEDTIGTLKDLDRLDGIRFRPRLIASFVRFADEICENRKRANTPWQEDGTLPPESKIFHAYASSIKSVSLTFQSHLRISFFVPIGVAYHPIGIDGAERYILSEIFSRLDKLNLERKYCNQYLLPSLRIDFMDIEIEIVNEAFKTVEHLEISVRDVGYPNVGNKLSEDPRYSDYCGVNIRNKLQSHIRPEILVSGGEVV